jgi:hypothetical protein
VKYYFTSPISRHISSSRSYGTALSSLASARDQQNAWQEKALRCGPESTRLVGNVFGLGDLLARVDDEELVVGVGMASTELFAAPVDRDVDRLRKPQADMACGEDNRAVIERLMLKIEEHFRNWIKKIGFEVNHLKCGRVDPSGPLETDSVAAPPGAEGTHGIRAVGSLLELEEIGGGALPTAQALAGYIELVEMDRMKDEDKSSRANGLDKASPVGIAIAVFIHGEITGIPELDVGDVIGLDVDSVFQIAVAAPALEFDDLRGADAIDVVHEFAGVGSNVGQDLGDRAGAELRWRRGARFAQIERKEGIERRGVEFRNRKFADWGRGGGGAVEGLEDQRKNMVEDEREFDRLARSKSEVQMRGRKRRTGHKDMVRTRRKIGENGVGRLIYNGREIGVEDRGMDLDLGWRIGIGFAKRLNQDRDGSKRAGLRGDANGTEPSAENESEN